MSQEFDYIIIGAGSAGNVLAAHLTENADVGVLLFEAGNPNYRFDFCTQMPAALAFSLQGRHYNWAYETDPEPYMDNRRMECSRGKGLGSLSLINGMCYVRGNALDFNGWAKEPGLEDWSYLDCLPYFREVKTRDIGSNDYHDGNGPVDVTTPKAGNNPLFRTMAEAGVQASYPRTDDLDDYQQEGFGPMNRTVTPGGRCTTTGRGCLDQTRGWPNLTIVTHALSDRILSSGKRAIGVSYLVGNGDNPITAHARREVLVCSGVITSPQLLQRSSVDPAAPLCDLDIPMMHDLPGVGVDLQDHLELYLQYTCRQPVSIYPATKWWSQPATGAQWPFLDRGLDASNQFEAGGSIQTREAFEWLNIQFHFLPATINYNGSKGVQEHGLQAHMGSIRSPSRGRIHLEPRDPRQHPNILFNYMSHEQDWQEFRGGIRLTREIMNQPVLDPYRDRGLSPGVNVQSDAELDKFVRNHAETAFHPSCSYEMGSDDMAVVDGQGRVYDMEGLRVVNASVMLLIITSSLNTTTVIMAEKIADRIRGRQPLPRSTAKYYVAGDAPVHGNPVRA